jgi:hypothetical protein
VESFISASVELIVVVIWVGLLWGLGLAIGAEAPVNDFGLLNRETVRLERIHAGSAAFGTVDVVEAPASPADEVVVIVHPTLVKGRGLGGLDPADEAVGGQGVEGVVNGLPGNRAEILAHDREDLIRAGMRVAGDRALHGETLSRYLEACLAKLCAPWL